MSSQKQQKFITSHRSRVRRANDYKKNSPEQISIFDREALVEFYLLEDVVRLYEYRLEKEKGKNLSTRGGKMGQKNNIEKFMAIINIFKTSIEVAWSEITSGNYKTVWKAIPEHDLMKAASSIKQLPKLRELAVKMLRELSNEALQATKENVDLDETLNQIEDHEKNVRAVRDLPAFNEIDEIIKAVEVAIPDDIKISKPNPNIN